MECSTWDPDMQTWAEECPATYCWRLLLHRYREGIANEAISAVGISCSVHFCCARSAWFFSSRVSGNVPSNAAAAIEAGSKRVRSIGRHGARERDLRAKMRVVP